MNSKNNKYNFEIIFQKLSQAKASLSSEERSTEDIKEVDEINKLREIVLDVSEENERYFSTA